MQANLFIKVLNMQDSLEEILDKRASLVRFGDGEFDIMRGASIPYQDYDPRLAAQMKKMVFKGSTPNLLVGLPDVFENLERYNEYCRNFYQTVFFPNNLPLLKEIEARYNVYVSTFISRPYMDLVDKSQSAAYFASLKKLWVKRDLLIVEGKYSRSGENNDLFKGANSIERIICPPNNAYAKKEQIEAQILAHGQNRLILLMLGPTAKIIVHDLAPIMNEQLIDLGHIDSEYEWMKMGATSKVKIPHKHTAEFNYDDRQVELESDPAFEQEIVGKVK